jgi:hypothetical protein
VVCGVVWCGGSQIRGSTSIHLDTSTHTLAVCISTGLRGGGSPGIPYHVTWQAADLQLYSALQHSDSEIANVSVASKVSVQLYS